MAGLLLKEFEQLHSRDIQPSMTARKAASCEARLPLKGFALRRLGGFNSSTP